MDDKLKESIVELRATIIGELLIKKNISISDTQIKLLIRKYSDEHVLRLMHSRVGRIIIRMGLS